MKLNKKRISILVSLMCLLLLLVFTLCSFDFPEFDTMVYSLGRPSSDEVSLLIQIMNLQYEVGSFNSCVPIMMYFNAYVNTIFVVLALPNATWSLGTNYNFTSSNCISVSFTTTGFTCLTNLGSFSTVVSNVVFYRSSFDSEPQYYSFSYSSDPVDPVVTDALAYWQDVYALFSSENSEYESGFSDGYESGYVDGFDTGFSYGEQFGYQDGYQDGIGTGYSEGYQQGEADGYDTGYSDGYLDGYETGYDSGYSEAERETVIEYVEPVELDVPSIFNSITSIPNNILQGSFDFDFFGINLYGLLKIIILLFIVSAVVVFIIKRSK